MRKLLPKKVKSKIRFYDKFIRAFVSYFNYSKKKERNYHFTIEDVALYAREKATLLKEMKGVEHGDSESVYRIEDVQLFWPNESDSKDIPWVYHEIYDEWNENPSSYDHPVFDYSRLDWIIDGGSAEGFLGLFVQRKGFNGKLLMVDPVSAFNRSVTRTYNTFYKPEKGWKILNVALGQDLGKITLKYKKNSLFESTVGENTQSFEEEIQVDLLTIDEVVNSNNLSGRGLIKLDVEDAEMDALKGALDTMRNSRPMLAVAVYHNYENAKLCKEIILSANSTYKIEFRGFYDYFSPPRPYILFAH
ncbi:MAG: FkbM family methyltransferase [Gammaproteobacteria bacterium]|nr:FkbM family methyltransferase [Gammaproteobacteria bacterium]